MVSAWILCTCLVASGPDGHGQPAVHPKKAESESQVMQALQAEAKGLDAERLTHLARAIALDPGNALARGLMGLVEYQGRWQRSEAAEAKAQEDPARAGRLREYLEKRARTPAKADAQVRLAEWCEHNGLKEQAKAHYRAALRLDPSRELAWKRLGYRKQGGRWVRPEDLAAEKAEAEAQKKADREWKPRLERIRDGLLGKDPSRREKAEADLASIHDHRAVPMILAIFIPAGERPQLAAVRALGQIEGPSASAVLADLAVFSPHVPVRDAASRTIMERDPREVIGRLIAVVRRPFRYKLAPGNGPGTAARLVVDGQEYNFERTYRFPTFIEAPAQPFAATLEVPNVVNNLPANASAADRKESEGRIREAVAQAEIRNQITMSQAAMVLYWNEVYRRQALEETARRNAAVEEGMERDVRTIEAINGAIEEADARALPLLRTLSGQDLGTDTDAWARWWTNELGYASPSSTPPKPTYTDVVSPADVAVATQVPVFTTALTTIAARHSCFAGGTPVRTIDGPRPIETIAVGDMVLSQDTVTGSISFRPVAAVHHNDPAPTLRLRIGGETITATGIHRFWKAGHGWTMARELKPGDRVRMVGASAVVESVEPDTIQPVYNLEIEGNSDFFVGQRGALVHDNSFVRPVEMPFDGLPSNGHQVETAR
ncbi:polymorphic toxin-type HINT domain-containing protein [Aquisphaera insulae]|uniref:polymorphic toxin-type HINT domain-containing protein n=1 Tax=Aquisphaera insulae TaxID=2712864 RepID=UPI0013EAC10F|nr:polymorphic toxin-type HINT domain-containing protein [Aquisphaera insulae]